MDNVFIERIWRSVKHERVYLFEHSTVTELRASPDEWFVSYNHWRPHHHLGNLTPGHIYEASHETPQAA